jgi:Flp pilus assembly protein TadD
MTARRVPVIVVAIWAVGLSVDTLARTAEYATPLTMARSDLERWPTGGAHYMVASELARVGRHDEATAEYRLAAPTFPRAHYNLADELRVAGRLDEAFTEYVAFVEDEPLLADVIPARLHMGQILAERQRWTEAIEQDRLVLAMTPDRADVQYFLAEALAGAHHFDEAVQHYQRYLESRPTDIGAWTDLGLAFVDEDRLDLAEPAFRRAVALAPRDGAVRANLARALLMDGKFEDARVELQYVVELAPGDREAAGTLQRLNAFLSGQAAAGAAPGATAR